MAERIKYTLNSLLGRFNISKQDLEDFIDDDLLLPNHWDTFNKLDQAKFRAGGFDGILWDVMEIERFERIVHIIQRRYDLFTHRVLTSVLDVRDTVEESQQESSIKLNKILLEVANLKQYIDKKDVLIDLAYFMDLTGYKPSTIRHNTVSIDEFSMYLKFEGYKNLTWKRRIKNGKWSLPLIELEETRKDLPYEIRLVEDQRTGRKEKRLGRNIIDII